MKTFADLKRRIKVGDILEMAFNKYQPILAGSPNLVGLARRVTVVQTNAIVLELPQGGGSWLRWPKAADVRIDGPDTFTVFEDGEVLLSYRIH